MNRPRLAVSVLLALGVVVAGAASATLQAPPREASLSRESDDQRGAVAKTEVRDAVEEEIEQQDGGSATVDPALVTIIPAGDVEPWSFFARPGCRLDANRLAGRVHLIRGPPLRG